MNTKAAGLALVECWLLTSEAGCLISTAVLLTQNGAALGFHLKILGILGRTSELQCLFVFETRLTELPTMTFC